MTEDKNLTGSKKYRKLAKEKLLAHTKSLRRDAEWNIQYYSDYVKANAEKLSKVEETAEKEVSDFIEAYSKLKAAGFKVETPYGLELRVKTRKRRLTDLYRAIGRLDGSKQSKAIANDEDGAAGIVTISLPSVRYPNVEITFKHKLKDTDSCKVEVETIPEKKQYRLTCARQ